MTYFICALRCSSVGYGMTAASVKKSSFGYSGIFVTVICVRTAPLGNIPCSLSSMARSRTSVLTNPFIMMSAFCSRIIFTAIREASSGFSAVTACRASLSANIFLVLSEQTNIGLIKPSCVACSIASCV